MRRLAVAAFLSCLLLTACESTQDKSARLAKTADSAMHGKGMTVRRQNRDVKVVATHVVQDENGTAAVVELRNTTRRPLARLPVAIDVVGKAKASLFRNDAAGLDTSLIEVSLLRPRKPFYWVNEQVITAERPRDVKAMVGKAKAKTPAKPPVIDLRNVRLRHDPDGLQAAGLLVNRSKIDQRRIVIYAVARKGKRVVAAGRGLVQRLRAGGRARFQFFFIGNPKGARLTLAAPPVAFR